MKIDHLLNSKKKIKRFLQTTKNKKVGMCHGVFDVVHLGHLKHFEFAKKKVDFLVVSLTSDRFVKKGDDRPIFSTTQRLQFLSKIKSIDFLIISDNETSEKNIKSIKPTYYFKDQEYKFIDLTRNIEKELSVLKKYNGKILYTNLETFSSSKIINKKEFEKENQELKKNIEIIKKKENIQKLLKELLNLKIRPLVIGEGIIDRYLFSTGLGKSGKDSILTLKKRGETEYLGGTFSISNNLSIFCKKVGLIAQIGSKNDKLNFIKKNLNKNIVFKPFIKKNCPTIIKTKIVDKFSNNKVIGLYEIDDSALNLKQEEKLFQIIKRNSKNYDYLLIADYDHGFISESMAKKIMSLKKPVISTSQLNAANSAYHDLKKLNGSKLMVINSNELRSYFKRKALDKDDIIYLAKKFLSQNDINTIIVTVGSNGSYCVTKKENFHIPALTKNIQGDKIGSGDTFMTMASISFILKKHPLTTMLLGAIAAKENLKRLGNANILSKNDFLKTLKYLFI